MPSLGADGDRATPRFRAARTRRSSFRVMLAVSGLSRIFSTRENMLDAFSFMMMSRPKRATDVTGEFKMRRNWRDDIAFIVITPRRMPGIRPARRCLPTRARRVAHADEGRAAAHGHIYDSRDSST